MNVVRQDVEKLVEKELEAANRKYPQFRSAHEGYAVMLEEYEEAVDELEKVNMLLEALWMDNIKKNKSNARAVEEIKKYSVRVACEAIQTAAMALKFQDGMENGWKGEGEVADDKEADQEAGREAGSRS